VKKAILKNPVFFKIIISCILIVFLGVAYNVNAIGEKPELNITVSTNKTSAYVNEEFEVTYEVKPQPLDISDINKKANKEIILVVDTSGSMNESLQGNKTRIAALKEAANSFIAKFQGEGTTKIGIVDYDYYGRQAKSLTNATNQSDLKAIINNLTADGATNIGDGIRVAYNMFSTDPSTKKYLVLMSDGMPTALTYSGVAGGYSGNKYYEESLYSKPNIYRWKDYFQESNKWSYYGVNSNAPIKYGTYGNTDPDGYCLKYSTMMADQFKKVSITNYVIGFSGSSDSTKLTQIANAGGGSYYDAKDAQAINEVYLNIADKIKADYSVEDIKLNFTLPDTLQYSMSNFDTIANGNSYIKSIPSIAYKLNSSKSQYIADPFIINLRFKGTKSGIYELGTNWTLSYKDVYGKTINKPIPKTTIIILKYNADFDVSRKLIPEENKGQFDINKEFQIEYTITPKPIKIETTDKTKEIMLVVDTSGSMNWSVDRDVNVSGKPSRLDLTKKALNDFINKFKDSKNVKIGLVTYANKGQIFMNNSNYLFDVNNTQSIRDKISSLDAEGGTNIGDGIRRAAWTLSANKESKKYIVLMTDGEPTFYSYSKDNSDYYVEIDNRDVFTNNGNDYERGLEYSKLMAGVLKGNKDLSIKTFAIGFSKGANKEKLQEIAESAGGVYVDATSDDVNAINKVYMDIADEIKTDLALEASQLKQQLPEGFVISESGSNSIIKDLKVNYAYNNTTKQYEAEPIKFTVKVTGTKVGSYEIKEDAKFSYTDLDGVKYEKVFDPLKITILDSFVIKQGLFQLNGSNPALYIGENNIKYVADLKLPPNVENNLGAFIRTSGQKTPIIIQLNSNSNTEVQKMEVLSVNVYAVKEDGSLGLTSFPTGIENNSSSSPNIKVTLEEEKTNGYKYYIINYNYKINGTNEDRTIEIINKAGVIGTDKYNNLNIIITSLPDVF